MERELIRILSYPLLENYATKFADKKLQYEILFH